MRDQKYWNIMIAAFFSSLGSSMYFIAVAWILYETTSDATYTGLMVGLGFLPGVILNLFFGILVDRSNRKRVTVQSLGVVTLAMILLLPAMVYQVVLPWMIIAVHMLVQTFSSLFRTAQQAFITEIYEKKEIPRIYSESGAATSVGGLLGTSLGGVALSIMSSYNVMLLVCISFALSMSSTMLVKHIKVQSALILSEGQRNSVLYDLVDSFRYVNRNPMMYSMFAIMFVGQLVMHTGAGMLSVYTSAYLNGTSTLYGILESSTSVGAILAGVTATYYLYKSKTFLPAGALGIVACGLTLLAVTRNNVVAFLSIFLIGLGTTWLRVLMQSVQQVATEPAYYGRMAACRQMVNQGAVAIGGPILGVVAEKYGVNYSYAVLLLPVLGSLVFSLRFAKQESFVRMIHSISR